MAMELSDIEEQLVIIKTELEQGYVLNQDNQKEVIDEACFKVVIENLERAKTLKTTH